MNPNREVIAGPEVPKGIGPYSAGVRAGDFLYVSGQPGTDPATGEPAGDTLGEQARQAMRNVEPCCGPEAAAPSSWSTSPCS